MIHVGDVRTVLPTLEAQSVQCVVTSPPYWGLRDYGVDGQLGLEATPDEYVAIMVGVFREVWRVLRDDGTLWLNMGDSYNTRTVTRVSSHQKGLGFSNDGIERSWKENAALGAKTRICVASPGGLPSPCEQTAGISALTLFGPRESASAPATVEA